MDISNFEQQDTFEHNLTTPSGEKLDIVFTLAGPTHPMREALEKKHRRRGLKTFNKVGKNQVPEDVDEIEAQATDMLVTYTLGWRNLAMNGQPIEYSEKAARELYGNKRFAWIRDAVMVACQDSANFLKRSSPN